MSDPIAVVGGTFTHPELRLYFRRLAHHPILDGKYLTDMVKSFSTAYFRKNKGDGYWIVTGVGAFDDLDAVFDRAGFEIDWSEAGEELDEAEYLDDLVDPIVTMHENRRTAYVYPRLLGFDETKETLGGGAMWDRDKKRFYLPVGDLIVKGRARKGLNIPDDVLDAAWDQHERIHVDEDILDVASKAALAKDVSDLTEEEIRALVEKVGDIPDWFGLSLYRYQRVGAIAVNSGHNLLADAMRVGKTRTSLAVCAMRQSERTLIVAPPVVLTNWRRNVEESNLATLGGKIDGQIVTIKAGRKEPDLPEKGVVIISDSLLTSRQELREKIISWKPDVTIYDEGHRAKNFESARAKAILEVAAESGFPLPLTGTPLFQSPQELAPLLEMTGHLTPVFGGLGAFLERYCTQDRWGRWKPKITMLADLRENLDRYVWVRRTKDQVLTELPDVTRNDIDLDVDLKLYREANKAVHEAIEDWLYDFYDEYGRLPSRRHVTEDARGREVVVDEITEYARDNGIRYISRMRKAAGLAKVPAAVEYIKDHVASTTERDSQGNKIFTRPLLVWTYHTEISVAMSEVVPAEVEDAAIIMGGISQNKRDRLIDDFQDGLIPVLVCQISAAGVGIDLTRSSDAIFVETEWTPALVLQAEERIQGVNQTRPVSISTFVAPETLDDRIQYIQHEKSKVLDPLLGGNNDVSVVVVSSSEADSAALLGEIIEEVIATVRKKNRNMK